MVFNEYIKKYAPLIESHLLEFFKSKKKDLEFNPYVLELFNNIEEYTMRGGKRLRPILMIVGYKLYGGKNEEEIIKASCSIEMVQSYLLIHDDVIDESNLRRNKPTLHKIYEKKYNDKKFGDNMAIIAGDLASIYAQQVLDSTSFQTDLKYKAMMKMASIIETTGYGQVIDVFSSKLNDFNEKDLFQLHEYKTAKYTIEGPLILGAILAGGNDFSLINNYSIPVGIAFQLQDDILGLFGDEETIGKPVTSDLEEGKKTLLILKAMEDVRYRDYILNILGKRNISRDELENIREIVRKTGALDYTFSLAKDLVKKGIEALKEIDSDEKLFLKEFAEYVIGRKF
ncbi:MAG: polyprenyl synthetase family protein [Thermoplasmata archaeon]|nr:polyprenyl synthetase family protein [Staphylococcus epidermidis]